MPTELGAQWFNDKIQPEIESVDQKRTWDDHAYFVTKHVMRAVGVTMRDTLARSIYEAIRDFKFVPGGRYLYATGRPYHQVNNCMLLGAHDSREGWADLQHNSAMALMSGAGIGAVYGEVRERGARIRKTGGFATGPVSLMQILNETGRHVQQGGSRRSAIWAGLPWSHPDIFEFIRIKNWPPELRALKEKDFSFPAPLDGTNISVQLDDDFFAAYEDPEHSKHSLAHSVYWETVRQMRKTGEPGFSIDVGPNAGETRRNACTELTSHDNNDVCNLASINMARIGSLDEFTQVMELALAFQVAGTVYSDVPYAAVDQVRTKNRRLGLGLMGITEWLLTRGKKYGPDEDLRGYLVAYSCSTTIAHGYCDQWSLSPCVKTRAIAPNGTISGYAGTTGGIEPIICVANKRRYLKGGSTWHYQYQVDPTAKRLIDGGIRPDDIEDAYDLAADVERRIEVQAFIQDYVDHGISSTINLPHWGSEINNDSTVKPFGDILYKYLPRLRGITCYPDGARGGQPITPVTYATAVRHTGKEMVEEGTVDMCEIARGGGCGD